MVRYSSLFRGREADFEFGVNWIILCAENILFAAFDSPANSAH